MLLGQRVPHGQDHMAIRSANSFETQRTSADDMTGMENVVRSLYSSRIYDVTLPQTQPSNMIVNSKYMYDNINAVRTQDISWSKTTLDTRHDIKDESYYQQNVTTVTHKPVTWISYDHLNEQKKKHHFKSRYSAPNPTAAFPKATNVSNDISKFNNKITDYSFMIMETSSDGSDSNSQSEQNLSVIRKSETITTKKRVSPTINQRKQTTMMQLSPFMTTLNKNLYVIAHKTARMCNSGDISDYLPLVKLCFNDNARLILTSPSHHMDVLGSVNIVHLLAEMIKTFPDCIMKTRAVYFYRDSSHSRVIKWKLSYIGTMVGEKMPDVLVNTSNKPYDLINDIDVAELSSDNVDEIKENAAVIREKGHLPSLEYRSTITMYIDDLTNRIAIYHMKGSLSSVKDTNMPRASKK